jgi:hypothetical protein
MSSPRLASPIKLRVALSRAPRLDGDAALPSGLLGGQTMLLSLSPEPAGCSTSPRLGLVHVLPSVDLARHSRSWWRRLPLAPAPGSSSRQPNHGRHCHSGRK